MKNLKLLLASLFALVTLGAEAQNVQAHYDFGRKSAITTVEMFRADGGGSTFFFVDMDYSPKVIGAYWEISRELCFWQKSKMNWFSVHVEYDGGLNTAAGSFNNAFLGGLTYSGHSKDWSKTWSITAPLHIRLFLELLASMARKIFTASKLRESGTWTFSNTGSLSMVLPISGVKPVLGRVQATYSLPSHSCE